MTAKNIGRGTKNQIARAKYADDPYILFRKGRLAAAFRASGLSINALAGKVGAKQQTLNRMFLQGKKCRAALLGRLTDVLKVPVAWITGEDDRLPSQLSIDVGLERPSVDGTPDRAFQNLTETGFVMRCWQAFARDVRTADETERQRLDDLEGDFLFALYALLNPDTWRRVLLAPGLDDEHRPWWSFWERLLEDDDRLPEPEEMEDRTTEAIVAALELVLRPWLEGIARLNYEKVVAWADIDAGVKPRLTSFALV